MTLKEAHEGMEYTIKQIETDDEEMNAFLFSLGCYTGEPITVVSHLKGGCVVSIKDGRYNIDNQLAEVDRSKIISSESLGFICCDVSTSWPLATSVTCHEREKHQEDADRCE